MLSEINARLKDDIRELPAQEPNLQTHTEHLAAEIDRITSHFGHHNEHDWNTNTPDGDNFDDTYQDDKVILNHLSHNYGNIFKKRIRHSYTVEIKLSTGREKVFDAFLSEDGKFSCSTHRSGGWRAYVYSLFDTLSEKERQEKLAKEEELAKRRAKFAEMERQERERGFAPIDDSSIFS